MRRILLLFPFALLALFHAASCQDSEGPDPKDQPVEIGLVRWNRDFEIALKRSKAESKPVLALFQEVPG